MTKKAVLELCERKYRSLKSYHGTTDVETLHEFPDGSTFPTPPELSEPPAEVGDRSSAEIWYSAPNLLRIKGNLSRFVWESSEDPFEIVCDGNSTWSRWSVTDQEWDKDESARMAIAGFTGVSGHACTTIPCLLLGEGVAWAIRVDSSEAEDVEEAGRPAWRVHILTEVGEVTHWVDQSSGLLVRMHSRTDLMRLHDRIADAHRRMAAEGIQVTDHWSETDDILDGAPAPIAMDTMEVFTILSCNTDLPASLFTRPDGAPE